MFNSNKFIHIVTRRHNSCCPCDSPKGKAGTKMSEGMIM